MISVSKQTLLRVTRHIALAYPFPLTGWDPEENHCNVYDNSNMVAWIRSINQNTYLRALKIKIVMMCYLTSKTKKNQLTSCCLTSCHLQHVCSHLSHFCKTALPCLDTTTQRAYNSFKHMSLGDKTCWQTNVSYQVVEACWQIYFSEIWIIIVSVNDSPSAFPRALSEPMLLYC